MRHLSRANHVLGAVMLGLALLGGLVSGQDDEASRETSTNANAAKASPTTSTASATHTVLVGKADHKFQPDITQALVGDTILFQFFPNNHSVVRAEYGYPCIPVEKTGVGKTGFFSGFQPVDAILDDPPSYSVRVNDTLPIFFYCSAPGSCIHYGMVGVINPNKSVSLETQREKAKASAFALSPGENFPDESDTPVSPSTSSSGTSTSSGPTAATTSAPKNRGLAPGAIAGIVCGVGSVALAAAALAFFVGRNRSLKDKLRQSTMLLPPGPPGSPPAMTPSSPPPSTAMSPLAMSANPYFHPGTGISTGHDANLGFYPPQPYTASDLPPKFDHHYAQMQGQGLPFTALSPAPPVVSELPVTGTPHVNVHEMSQ